MALVSSRRVSVLTLHRRRRLAAAPNTSGVQTGQRKRRARPPVPPIRVGEKSSAQFRMPRIAKRDVFINLAFSPDSEHLFLSLITGITSVGMTPASVLQVPAGQARIDRLFARISQCA